MAAVTRSAVVPIGQVLLRDDGVLREGNARAAALLGAESAQSLAGATLASLIGPRAAVTVHAHVCAGETDACEVVARRRDGSADAHPRARLREAREARETCWSSGSAAG